MGILDKFINIGGSEKTLYCKKCKKYTSHVSLSYAKSMYGDEPTNDKLERWLGRPMARLMDFSIVFPVLFGVPYICKECADQDSWKMDGGIFTP